MNSRRNFFRSIEIIVYTYQNRANLMMRIFAFVFFQNTIPVFSKCYFAYPNYYFFFFSIYYFFFFFRNLISFYRDIISILRTTNSFHQNKILFHSNYSEWLLLNANSAICQLYHKLIFNEMMMKSALY